MCDRLVSSSLHGIIASHAFGKKCAWVSFGGSIGGDDTKFFDYALSVKLNIKRYDFQDVVSLNALDLIKVSDASELPDLDDVQRKLWNSCPF